MELDDRDVVTAWRTHRLHWCIHWLDRRRVAGGEIGVHRSGIPSERGYLHTEDGVASQDVYKAAAVAVTHCEQTRSVNAEARGDISDECIHVAKVVNVGVLATRSPGRVRLVPFAIPVDVHHDRIRVDARVIHSGLRLDCLGISIVTMEAEDDRCSMVHIVEFGNVYQIAPRKTIRTCSVD